MTLLRTSDAATLDSGTPSKKKRRSPADIRRDAARLQKRAEQRLAERSEAWAHGGRDAFLVVKQDGHSRPGSDPDGYLRPEVRDSLPDLHQRRRRVLAGGEDK